MDRVNQLRNATPGSSKDSSLDISQSADHYLTANDVSSKYFSLTDVDSTVTTASSKDSSPAAAAEAIENETSTLIESLSPINQKNDDFQIGKQIEAAKILSGGVDIFDNDNSFDGNELVIDDNVTVERQESNIEEKLMIPSNDDPIQENKSENYEQNVDSESAIPSKDTEVILQIDGKNMDAIDIGNGLYLYRKDGQDKELAAVQILEVDHQQQGFKFLKVRENSEGNLEVYEEIVEVHKEIPENETLMEKNTSHVPIKDINKIINDHSTTCKVTEKTTKLLENESSGLINSDLEKEKLEVKSELNLDGKGMKISESSRKSPLVGTFTPMTFHSTPNKEGIPLTKTMVDMQLHPNRHNDTAKKMIEVNTDNCRQKINESLTVDSNETHKTQTSSKKCLFSDKKTFTSANTVESDKRLATAEERISTDLIITSDSQNLEKQYILKRNSDKNLYSNEKSANTAHIIDNDHLILSKGETDVANIINPNSDNILLNKTTKLTVVENVLNTHEIKPSDLKQQYVSQDFLIPNATDAIHNKQDMKNQCKEELGECLINVKSSQPKNNGCKDNKPHYEIECELVKAKTKFADSPEERDLIPNKFDSKQKLESVSADNKNNRNTTSIKVKIEKHTDIQKNVAVEKPKSANNNIAVPFGKWTEANKQEYLNKIKESKVPSVAGSTNQIKQPKDLNRRDVLNKIDIARNTLQSKDSSNSLKSSVKSETKEINKLPNEMITVENVSRNDHAINSSTKSESENRTAINNQDLIDKTIEGILMDKIVTTKVSQENDVKLDSGDKTVPDKTSINFDNKYGIEQQTSILDDIEKKLNELHGQPSKQKVNAGEVDSNTSIVENNEVVNIKIAPNKIPNLVRLIGSSNAIKQKSKELGEYSDEEILECEPITGDTELMKMSANTSYKTTETKVDLKKDVDTESIRNKQISQDDNKSEEESNKVITEKDFDKFARRNSVTYENCITVNFTPQKANVVQNIVPSDLTAKKDSSNTEVKLKSQFRPISLNEKLNSPMRLLTSHNDSYNSKNPNHRMTYNMVLNPKRQKESPITIIEDKPVEVIFVESAREFQPLQLNAQGQKLTSNMDNDNFDYDSYTVSSCDSLDSDMLDSIDDKPQDETHVKPKHQRKQVLTPVETPDMELIEPKDLGIEVKYKRKRKTEDSRRTSQRNDEPVSKKNTKNLVPKKSYLLGRNKERDEKQNISTLPMEKSDGENRANADNNTFKIIDSYEPNSANCVFHHNTNAIDNLVKAAELLEKQTESNQNLTVLQTSTDTSPQPAKRGRGRPRKYPAQDSEKNKTPSPQKKPKLTNMISKIDTSDEDTDDEVIARKNWTMGKINENIICPICNKLFRSENVVFKHVKHCAGSSPTKADSPELKSSLNDSKVNYQNNKKDETDKIEKGKPKNDQIKKVTQETIIDDDIILIEDSFHTDTSLVKSENKDATGIINKDSLSENKSDSLQSKTSQTNKKSLLKLPVTKLICEICGKTFRQLSYLTHHKLLHKKSATKESAIVNEEKIIFSCEICKKEFRKLHHLVQHRLNHSSSISMNNKSRRKSAVEQNVIKHTDTDNKSVDQGAGFRCEPCDKSFRKLHHLVEHRETHDGINKSKNLSSQISSEKNLTLPPQCDICNKTFRKLHHMIEHKEQHNDSKKDDKGDTKSTLIAKDIIHECSLCYMVFPNEHALNKHFIKCQRKKKSAKLKKDEKDMLFGPESVSGEALTDTPLSSMIESESIDLVDTHKIDTVTVKPVTDDCNILETRPSSGNNEVITHLNIPSDKKVEKNVYMPPMTTEKHASVKKSEINVNNKSKDTPKTPSSEKIKTNVTKKNRISETSITNPLITKHDFNDDDDNIRYMLNPNYIPEDKMKNFLKVRASKRNSLVVGSYITRRMSTQNSSKAHNSKIETTTKVLPGRSSMSDKSSVRKTPKKKRSIGRTTNAECSEDENEIKYSFPKPPRPLLSKTRKSLEGKTQTIGPTITVKKILTPKIIPKKPKALGTTSKRNSLEKRAHTHTSESKTKIPTHKQTEVKRRNVAEVGHKCDCGQLFSSAALLARHATLAHTPPRRRRPSPPPLPAARRPAAHRALPLIEKKKKIKDKLK